MVVRLLIISLGILLPAIAQALNASLDRERMTRNETIQLTLQSELSISQGMDLFSLNTMNIKSPDTSALERDFDILDRQQRYQVKLVNGENQSVITWLYTLQPRRSGQLIIPTLSLGSARSQPLLLEVMDPPSGGVSRARDVIIEAEFEAPEALVDEQVLLTVRILYRGDLINGELDHPEHPQALFFQLGKQREYAKYAFGQHYKVVERRYAVFAKQAGRLTLPTLDFSGRFLVSPGSRNELRRASSPQLELKVLSPPEAFQGLTWLPAQGLSMQQTWSSDSLVLRAGDSLTRTLSLQALGQDAANLPPLPLPELEGLKIYTEPAALETEAERAGLTANRVETWTLIATQPGLYTLPAITVRWWDTFSQRQREARLPERRLEVLAAGTQGRESESTVISVTAPDALEMAAAQRPIPWLTWAMGLLALIAAILYARERRRRRYWEAAADGPVEHMPVFSSQQSDLISQLAQALNADPQSLPVHIAPWLRRLRQDPRIPAARQQEIEDLLREACRQVQDKRYSRNPEENTLPPGDCRQINQQLIQALQAIWPHAPSGSDVDHLYQYGFDEKAHNTQSECRK